MPVHPLLWFPALQADYLRCSCPATAEVARLFLRHDPAGNGKNVSHLCAGMSRQRCSRCRSAPSPELRPPRWYIPWADHSSSAAPPEVRRRPRRLRARFRACLRRHCRDRQNGDHHAEHEQQAEPSLCFFHSVSSLIFISSYISWDIRRPNITGTLLFAQQTRRCTRTEKNV